MFLLLLVSAIFTVNEAEKQILVWEPVDVDVKEVFTDLNKEYNVAWDDNLASEALKFAKNPVDIKANLPTYLADKFVKGKRPFNHLGLSMEEKVRKSLEKNIGDRRDEFKRFEEGTRFGCKAVVATTRYNNDVVSSVCLYKRP